MINEEVVQGSFTHNLKDVLFECVIWCLMIYKEVYDVDKTFD